MLGFIRVSPYLVRNLKPHELTLYYSIEHFNITKAYCFASAATLMQLSGIRSPRTYRKAIKTLLDRGLIVQHGRRGGRGAVTYQSLFAQPNDAFPALKSFLFNTTIRPAYKVITLARQIYPKATAAELAACLKMSVSTIKHSPKTPPALVRSVFQPPAVVQITAEAGCKKCTIRNIPESKKKITTEQYISLIGEPIPVPQDTNPVVILNMRAEEERQIKALQEKQTQAAIETESLNILDEYPEYKILVEDLRRLTPKLSDAILIQAAFETVKKAKTIKGTRLAYAMGIIRQHLATFPDRPHVQTIIPAGDILARLSKQSQAKKAQVARQNIERNEAAESHEAEDKNRQYFDNLTEQEREAVTPVIESLGNPAGVKFISAWLIQKGALAHNDFIRRCKEMLLDCRVDTHPGTVDKPRPNRPPFASATPGGAQYSGWPVLQTGWPSY